MDWNTLISPALAHLEQTKDLILGLVGFACVAYALQDILKAKLKNLYH